MRVLFLISFATGLAMAQADLPAALDQIASSELSRQKIPGIAAAVVKDDQVVWITGLGVTSLESKTPVTPDTLFRMGSARVFLASALYELSAQGRLQLNTPAGDYLFGLDDKQARLSAEKLLSPPSEVGEEAVAGRLIENIRAQPASAVLDDMIFAPLSMQHTTFAPGVAITYPLALGHTMDGKISRPMESGGLFTSASDVARFLAAFVNDGKVGGILDQRQVLPVSMIAALSSDSGYGMDADASRGVRLIRQTSAASGYTAAILMAPQFHTGVVVLANRDGASAITIAQKLLERSLPVRFPQSLAVALNRSGMRRFLLLIAGALAAFSQTRTQLDLDSFEKVWTTVRDKHWEAKPGGLDWPAIHNEYRPRVEKAATRDEARAVTQEMLGRLKQSHFAIIPAVVYSVLDDDGEGPGVPGIDARVLDGHAVVTGVDPGSPAEKQGVRVGWEIQRAGGKDIKLIIEQAHSNPAIHELQLTRAVLARLSGQIGGMVDATFLDGSGKPVVLKLDLAMPRGTLTAFGNLPAQNVWFETKRIGGTAYIRFNLFLDLPRVMASFQQTVENCKPCDGLIIDLRGNPGGIGGMAMGMAGFLVDKPNQRLGTMYLRDSTLNFVVNPRADVFSGPVAVLVDGCSASTSEIFAGGLKDLGRARVFGTRSAAAALPSNFERLPNGDGFQYAVANYVSQGGQPLEGLGVTPDVVVELTREALLAGHDPVVDAALGWIRSKK